MGARLAVHDIILSRLSEHHEFVRQLLAESAAGSLRHLGIESTARKNLEIRLFYDFVKTFEVFLRFVKAVHVFHAEFASAHDAAFCAELVAVLLSYLIDGDRKIFVRAS